MQPAVGRAFPLAEAGYTPRFSSSRKARGVIIPNLLERDVAAEFRSGQHLLELEQDLGRDNQLERAAGPAVQQLPGWSLCGDHRGDEYVGVEDGP